MKKHVDTRQAVYDFIKDFIEKMSYPPTVREIGKALSLKSTSTVHMHLKALVESGHITMHPSRQRSIALTQRGDEGVPARSIPVVGSVAAGEPIWAVDHIQEYFKLPVGMLHGARDEEVFMLHVEGDSMIDAGILSGDLIVVHRGISISDGDIVVARVLGDTATVKRLYRELYKIKLQPENANMEPIYARYEDVEVVGKVIGLVRRY